MALDTIDQSQHEIAMVGRRRGLLSEFGGWLRLPLNEDFQVLKSLLEPDGLPTLIHCTQGKDRTGLVIALILMMLDVPISAIEHDYTLSNEGLVQDKEQRLAEIREIDLPEDWHNTAPGMIVGISEHLACLYGGVDSYLDTIGFRQTERQQLRERVLY